MHHRSADALRHFCNGSELSVNHRAKRRRMASAECCQGCVPRTRLGESLPVMTLQGYSKRVILPPFWDETVSEYRR
jgi:hypothetical protein